MGTMFRGMMFLGRLNAFLTASRADSTTGIGLESGRCLHGMPLPICRRHVRNLQWFDMRRDESLLTEFLPQLPFNSPRSLVGLLQGGVAVHAEMDINGPVVSDAARAQTVGQRSALRFVDDIDDELLFVLWQGFLKQFLYARHKEFKRRISGKPCDADCISGVRTLASKLASTARRIKVPSSFRLKYSKSMATERICAKGLAIFKPFACGQEP